jgi:hypothetical protein
VIPRLQAGHDRGLMLRRGRRREASESYGGFHETCENGKPFHGGKIGQSGSRSLPNPSAKAHPKRNEPKGFGLGLRPQRGDPTILEQRINLSR